MTLSRDPTIRKLNACGCCEGLGAETPEAIENRPGLSAIAYRIGTHSRFNASMLSRLSASDLPALNDLTTRASSDLTIALIDSWAVLGDVLTFYQERIANEAYLRTATERRSLAALAELIGYLPRPGVAASAYLAFTVEDSEGSSSTPVAEGTRVQSVPGPGEKPQVFETVEAIEAHADWNEMAPLLLQKHPSLDDDTETITVQGVSPKVQKGDAVLLVWGNDASERVVKRVIGVTPDPSAKTTQIDFEQAPAASPAFTLAPFAAAAFASKPAQLTGSVVAAQVLNAVWNQANLATFSTVQKWSLMELSASVLALVESARQTTPTDSTGVFVFRQRAAIFGHNAPDWDSLPATQRMHDYVTKSDGALEVKEPPYPTTWEGRTLQDELTDAEATSVWIDLDRTYPGIVAGSWLALEQGSTTRVSVVSDCSELSRAAFTLSGKVSRVTLDSTSSLRDFQIRKTSVLAQSERLDLAELPITDVIKGSSVLLDGPYLGLEAGRPVIVNGTRADLDGVESSEVMILDNVLLKGGMTELVFKESLANEYVRSSVTINANIALATHGESKKQALGSGNANEPFQKFKLPESPLTYVSADNSTGAESTLAVKVNDVEWTDVDFLHGHDGDEQVYITRTDDQGRTIVQFGDGQTGARLPTGQENVRAAYRKGIGEDGLVGQGQLTLLATKPLGVRTVTNPVAADGAADCESADEVRSNATLGIRTLDRIVSLRDYEDFARAFSGIAKALATWTWDGQRRGVLVTVAGLKGRAASSRTRTNLLAAIAAAGDPRVPVRVESYLPAFFQLSAKVRIDSAYDSDQVKKAVEQALRKAFSFAAREFGQPVAKSEVIAVIQSVAGVLGVDLDELFRSDATAAELSETRLFDRLAAQVPRAGTEAMVGAELLTLDPRPVLPGAMPA